VVLRQCLLTEILFWCLVCGVGHAQLVSQVLRVGFLNQLEVVIKDALPFLILLLIRVILLEDTHEILEGCDIAAAPY